MNLNYFRKNLRNLGREPLELDFLGNAPHFQTLWIKAAASKLGLDVKAKSGLGTATKINEKETCTVPHPVTVHRRIGITLRGSFRGRNRICTTMAALNPRIAGIRGKRGPKGLKRQGPSTTGQLDKEYRSRSKEWDNPHLKN